ncbi:MAG: hypothetical protein J6A62_02265 [Oscillospiraceae bacterium]|nr:hypothetical protein [Oscillospiraceae bacterium]
MKLVIPTKLVVFSKKELPFWELILIAYLFCPYLLPSVSLGTTLVLGLLVLYCGYLALQNRYMLKFVSGVLLLITVLALAYALLTDTATISENVSNRDLKRFVSKFYQYLTLYFPAILFVRVERAATEEQKKFFAALGIILIVCVVITTWVFLLDDPNATREWDSFEENSKQGVANYYFIYAVPIIISIATIILVKSKGIVKIVSLACIIFGILFLVSAQYTLSILIAIFGVLIQIFRNLRSGISKIIFIFLMIILALFLPEIIEFAVLNIRSEQVSTRLSEIHAFLTGSGAGGYNLSGRLTLYGNTIKAFVQSPIWGNRSLGFDGHATFLTVLSDTGLLGGIPFYVLLATAYGNVEKWIGSKQKQFNVIVLMFIMMGLTNPVHASLPLGLVTWFLAPLIIQMILKENTENETAVET